MRITSPRTPAVAVARELRRLGLVQGKGNDFRVRGHRIAGERDHTYVDLLNADARQVVADNADELERALANGPFPFTVSVRYYDSPNPWPSIRNGHHERIRDERPAAPAAEEEAAPVEPARTEVWDNVPGIIAGPGVLVPGVHVECLPEHRPGPRTRYAHGGIIQSVGPVSVRWRPYGYDKDIRTPLEHMRVNACAHVNMRASTKLMAAELNAGRPLPRHPEWVYWNLAQHVEYAATAAAEAADVEETEEEEELPAVEEPAAPAGPVVVIPCGAAKLSEAARAGDLYTGSYHRACARAAAALTADGGTVLILSALYGLTPLDRVVEPYDLRMGQAGSVTGAQLREQARELGLDTAADVVVLAGATYTAAAREVWPAAVTPLAGMGGMGYQLQRLAAIAAGELSPAAAPAEPVTDYRAHYQQEEEAGALGWSTRHAQAVSWAAAGELVRDADGTPRRITAGRTGRRVAAALLPPLLDAGFLTDADRGGVTHIELTADGRRALLAWEAHRPVPVERTRKQERLPLRPLRGGQEARRRAAEFEAAEAVRRAEWDGWYAEFELRRAEEERADRMWDAWARVADITHRLGRKHPAGWVPTEEEVLLHGLDPAVVEDLRADAAALTAKEEPAVVEEPAHPADGDRARSHPDTPHDSSRCNLTLQHNEANIGSAGRAQGPTEKGPDHEPHDPHSHHRGRRRRDRRAHHPHDRGGRTQGSRPGDGRPDHHVRRNPRPDPHRVRPPHRTGRDTEGSRDRRRPERHRELLQPRRYLTRPPGAPSGGCPARRTPRPHPGGHPLRKTLTTRTLPVFTGSTAAGMTFADVTVLLVRMTYAQLRSWSWVGNEWTGEAVHEGWEVRDVTGALLGVLLPIGHHATRIHAEWYDPATDDFYAAGETSAPVLTQGIARVLDSRAAHVGAVPAGDPFALDEPRFLPVRVDCWAGVCPPRCPECEADHVRQEEARLQYAAA